MASELHDGFRVVLEAQRSRVQNDTLSDQVVFTSPFVRPGPERQLVDRRPILDHVDLVRRDAEPLESRQEAIGDDRDCIACEQERALERYEAVPDRRSEPSVALPEDSPNADPEYVLLPENKARAEPLGLRQEALLGEQRRVRRKDDIGAELADACACFQPRTLALGETASRASTSQTRWRG